jgi:hypothetical protein
MEQNPGKIVKPASDMEYVDFLIRQMNSGMQYDEIVRAAIVEQKKMTDPVAKQKLEEFIAKYTPGLK